MANYLPTIFTITIGFVLLLSLCFQAKAQVKGNFNKVLILSLYKLFTERYKSLGISIRWVSGLISSAKRLYVCLCLKTARFYSSIGLYLSVALVSSIALSYMTYSYSECFVRYFATIYHYLPCFSASCAGAEGFPVFNSQED